MSVFVQTPAGIYLFVTARSIANRVRRLVRRLKEPRYLAGFLFGAVYFGWFFFRPIFQSRNVRAGERVRDSVLPETLSLLLVAASVALAFLFLLSWLFRKGKPALSLSEAEAQFFFPGPLPRRSVLHYALLRPQLGLIFTSLVFMIFFSRAPIAERWRAFLASWVALSTIHFHGLGMAFWKATWEKSSRVRALSRLRVTLLSFLGLGLLLFWLGRTISSLAQMPEGPDLAGLRAVLFDGWLGTAAQVFLAPFRAVVGPAFATDVPSFLLRLSIALAILLLHYVWVMRSTARYEEATLEHASRRAELRAAWRRTGRLRTAPSAGKRQVVPFPLPPTGRPEMAVVWKNLIFWHRIRLKSFARGAALVAVALFVLSSLFLSVPERRMIAVGAAIGVATLAAALATLAPAFLPIDFRQDLEHVDQLRVWPLPATRLVAAELAAPWIFSVGYLWTGLACALAVAHGSLIRMDSHAAGPGTMLERAQTYFAPLALAGALFLPAVSAMILIVQNGALLTFPAWFPMRQRKGWGLEATGTQMLSLLVTALLLAIAAIPAALVGGLLFLLLRSVLGVWAAPIAAPFASLPLWGEVALGIAYLGRLFQRLDPSRDLTD